MNPILTQLDPVVYVVDDDTAVLDSVSLLLRSNGLQVLPCDSARHFLTHYVPGHIGCLILDIRMPGMSGLELQQTLNDTQIDVPVIFITGHGDVQQCSRAFKAGAIDFLPKPIDELALLDSVRRGIQDSIRRHDKHARTQEIETQLGKLSRRELEILGYIVDGRSSREVAIMLDLSPRTVEAHRANIYTKLGVDTLADLVKFYLAAVEDGKLAGLAEMRDA